MSLFRDEADPKWQRGLSRGFAAARLLGLLALCIVRKRSVRRVDYSSRGVLISVMRLSVILKPQ
jgi:hypothetical protein